MGSILLCRNRSVKEPYYVKELGIMLYSAEELSYYIYHNAILIGEDFLDERLYRFIGRELAMEDLEHKLRKWSGQADLPELLLVILQDIHYYSSDELYSFREMMKEEAAKSPAVRMMERAEMLIRSRRLSAAGLTLKNLLAGDYPELADDAFAGRAFYLSGLVCAGQYLWQDAAECMDRAHEKLQDEESLKKLCQILLIDPGVTLPVMPEPDEFSRASWEAELEAAKDAASQADRAQAAVSMLEKDNIRRAEGFKGLVRGWKNEYRQELGGL